MSETLIEVKNLQVHFKRKSSKLLSFKPEILKAVDNVNFTIEKGKTFGLVGESGSGKSTIGKAILRYHKPTGGEFSMRERKSAPCQKRNFCHTERKCSPYFRTRILPWIRVIRYRISSVSQWRSIRCTLQQNEKNVPVN